MKNELKTRDTALALIFLVTLVDLFSAEQSWLYVSGGLALLAMISPNAFKLPSLVWFGLSEKLGFIMSKIILSIIFYVVLMPLGLLRRLFRSSKENLNGGDFVDRCHVYKPKDFERIF